MSVGFLQPARSRVCEVMRHSGGNMICAAVKSTCRDAVPKCELRAASRVAAPSDCKLKTGYWTADGSRSATET